LFERPHHRRIARVLEALDGERLGASACLFGGGTAMALRFGEYRESLDIDFLVSDLAGYRLLRQQLADRSDLAPLLRPGHSLPLTRPWRADQYGLRTRVQVDEVEIKFEIALEARIALDEPQELVCGVPSLSARDLVASKLLALADRWADDAVHSRDLIDLAMMAPPQALFLQGLHKAQAAYGQAPVESLNKAVAALRQRPQRLDQCLRALDMQGLSKAELWSRIKALARRLPKA